MPGSDVPLTMFCGPLPTMSGDVVIVMTILVLWGNFDKSHPFVGLCVINSSCVHALNDRMFIENVFITRMHFRSFVVVDIVCLSAPGKLHLTDILSTCLFSPCRCLLLKWPIQETWTCVHTLTTWLSYRGEIFKIGTALLPCWRMFWVFFLCTPSCSMWQPLILW